VATADTEQQLAWEARQRPRAAAAAVLAAIFSLAADLWTNSIVSGAPKAGFLDSLARAAQPGPLGRLPSLRTPYFQFIEDHATALVLANVVKALGFIALAWVLTFLVAAVRARRPQISRPFVYLALIGAVLSAVAGIGFWGAYENAVSSFLSGPHTVDRAADAGSGSVLLTSQVIGLVGQLALAAGYVFVSLNAMRAGLLPRFMGILGCIIGVLVVIPLGPLPVVQTFWLLALGVLLLGRWPAGTPPAWASGQAEPWPSQAEVSAKRREAMQARRRGGRPAEPASEPEREPVAAVPQRAKRKRKQR
jgi:hypothetical protein